MSNLDFLNELAEDKLQPIKLDSIEDKIKNLASTYKLMLINELDEAGSYSSGELHKSIDVAKIERKKEKFIVYISIADYADFVDEGVSGWAKDRGSRFKYKKKGVPKIMVQSVAKWIEKSKKIKVKIPISRIEKKGISLADAKIKQASSIAFMIKRQGFEGSHFWKKATDKFEKLLEDELGIAVEILLEKTFTK